MAYRYYKKLPAIFKTTIWARPQQLIKFLHSIPDEIFTNSGLVNKLIYIENTEKLCDQIEDLGDNLIDMKDIVSDESEFSHLKYEYNILRKEYISLRKLLKTRLEIVTLLFTKN